MRCHDENPHDLILQGSLTTECNAAHDDQGPVLGGNYQATAGFGDSSTSPVLPKIKRTKTTMERVERKKSRTAGTNTTLDDLCLHRSIYEGSWEKNMDAVDDAIDFLGEPKTKKRKSHCDSQSQDLLTLSSQKKHRAQSNTISRGHPEKQLVFGNVELRDALIFGNERAPNSNPKEAVDNEQREEHSRSDERDRQHPETSSRQIDCAATDILTTLPSVVVVNGKSTSHAGKEVHDDQDELAGDGKEPAPSTKTSKRKKRKQQDSSQQDRFDPWANDPDLPQEHYRPRRSRFQGGEDDVDELIETIDFSKRPEAVAKSKKKSKLNRRKTTGGAIVVHVDEEEEGSPFVEVEAQPFEPVKSRTSKTPVPSIEKHEEPGEIAEPELNPPKRKRGRPKKEVGREPASEAGTIALAIEEPKLAEEPLPKSGEKKKKKKLSTLSDADEQAETAMHDDAHATEEAQEPPEAEPTSDFAPDAKDPPTTPSPQKPKLKPLNDKTNVNNASVLPSPDLGKPAAETPRKEDKGPTRHSPISSSKVRYRLGLSRRARIEPLLRIVRK